MPASVYQPISTALRNSFHGPKSNGLGVKMDSSLQKSLLVPVSVLINIELCVNPYLLRFSLMTLSDRLQIYQKSKSQSTSFWPRALSSLVVEEINQPSLVRVCQRPMAMVRWHVSSWTRYQTHVSHCSDVIRWSWATEVLLVPGLECSTWETLVISTLHYR